MSEAKAREVASRLMALARSDAEVVPAAEQRAKEDAGVDAGALLERFDYQRSRRFLTWYDGVLRAHQATAEALTQRAGEGDLPSDQVTELLLDLHRLLLTHPVATKSAFRALVSEGRAYAETEEGRALRERLLRSSNMRRASLLFRSLSMGLLNDEGSSVLPSSYVDQLFRLVDEDRVEAVLAALGRKVPGS